MEVQFPWEFLKTIEIELCSDSYAMLNPAVGFTQPEFRVSERLRDPWNGDARDQVINLHLRAGWSVLNSRKRRCNPLNVEHFSIP